jgi:hypothetical protein
MFSTIYRQKTSFQQKKGGVSKLSFCNSPSFYIAKKTRKETAIGLNQLFPNSIPPSESFKPLAVNKLLMILPFPAEGGEW